MIFTINHVASELISIAWEPVLPSDETVHDEKPGSLLVPLSEKVETRHVVKSSKSQPDYCFRSIASTTAQMYHANSPFGAHRGVDIEPLILESNALVTSHTENILPADGYMRLPERIMLPPPLKFSFDYLKGVNKELIFDDFVLDSFSNEMSSTAQNSIASSAESVKISGAEIDVSKIELQSARWTISCDISTDIGREGL